jgi:hypothetical protein
LREEPCCNSCFFKSDSGLGNSLPPPAFAEEAPRSLDEDCRKRSRLLASRWGETDRLLGFVMSRLESAREAARRLPVKTELEFAAGTAPKSLAELDRTRPSSCLRRGAAAAAAAEDTDGSDLRMLLVVMR